MMKLKIFFPVIAFLICLTGCLSKPDAHQSSEPHLVISATPISPLPSTKTVVPTRSVTDLFPTSALSPTPLFFEKLVIGFTEENRPLDVFRFGNGPHHLMIVAGIHGGYEWNTVSLADQLVEKLISDPSLVPADKTLYILRLLNPDGYAKDDGPDGRANANNVDLNRNWDANWQTNWWGSECWNYRFITAGSKPFSELETQALSKFLLDNHIEALISYHSAGLGIFPGGWPNDMPSLKLAYSISLISPYPYPPIETDCYFSGQMVDWAAAHGIAAVDIELNNHVDTDLLINLEVLKKFLNWQP